MQTRWLHPILPMVCRTPSHCLKATKYTIFIYLLDIIFVSSYLEYIT